MATSQKNSLLDRLRAEKLTLLVERGGKRVFASDRRGIRTLYEAVSDNLALFEGSEVADKVVGLAAAYILVYARAGKISATLMSQEARRFLKDSNVPHDADSFVKALDEQPHEAVPAETIARASQSPSTFVEELRARLAP
jgi:hypothetical protein